MEKELKIIAPEGYEIDKENSNLECVRFKTICNRLPMSWEELKKIEGWYVSTCSLTVYGSSEIFGESDKNIFPSKEEAQAMLAMAQLCQLRDAWNNGWKPDWRNSSSLKYCIEIYDEKITTITYTVFNTPMAFKTRELRDEFLKTFRDLLEIAKPFL